VKITRAHIVVTCAIAAFRPGSAIGAPREAVRREPRRPTLLFQRAWCLVKYRRTNSCAQRRGTPHLLRCTHCRAPARWLRCGAFSHSSLLLYRFVAVGHRLTNTVDLMRAARPVAGSAGPGAVVLGGCGAPHVLALVAQAQCRPTNLPVEFVGGPESCSGGLMTVRMVSPTRQATNLGPVREVAGIRMVGATALYATAK